MGHLFKERLDCLQSSALVPLPMEEAEGQTGQWKGRKIHPQMGKNTEDIHYYKNIMPLTHLNKKLKCDIEKGFFPTHRRLKFSYSVFKITRFFLRSQSQSLLRDRGVGTK